MAANGGWSVALSGGGIRSASFSSGAVAALLDKNVDIEELSCVSGGGYFGRFVTPACACCRKKQ